MDDPSRAEAKAVADGLSPVSDGIEHASGHANEAAEPHTEQPEFMNNQPHLQNMEIARDDTHEPLSTAEQEHYGVSADDHTEEALPQLLEIPADATTIPATKSTVNVPSTPGDNHSGFHGQESLFWLGDDMNDEVDAGKKVSVQIPLSCTGSLISTVTKSQKGSW